MSKNIPATKENLEQLASNMQRLRSSGQLGPSYFIYDDHTSGAGVIETFQTGDWTSQPVRRKPPSSELPKISYHGYPKMDVKFSGALAVQSSTGERSINRYYELNETQPSLVAQDVVLQNTDLVQFCGTANGSNHLRMASKFSPAAGRIAFFQNSRSGYEPKLSCSGFWIAERYFITVAHMLELLDDKQRQELCIQSKPRSNGVSAWVSTSTQIYQLQQPKKEDHQVFLVKMSVEDDIALFQLVDENDFPPHTLAHFDLEPANISTDTPIFTIAYPGRDTNCTEAEIAHWRANVPELNPLIDKLLDTKGNIGRLEILYHRYLMTEKDAE